jgi:hypothetical protein
MEIIAHAARTNAKPQARQAAGSFHLVSNMIIEQQIHTDTQMELLIFNLQVGPFSPFSPEKNKTMHNRSWKQKARTGVSSMLCAANVHRMSSYFFLVELKRTSSTHSTESTDSNGFYSDHDSVLSKQPIMKTLATVLGSQVGRLLDSRNAHVSK